MTEESNLLLEMTKDSMKHAVQHLEHELQKIRAGKASPQMLDGIKVDYYGTPTSLDKIANISTPDARQIAIQPWERSMIAPIEKAIMAANLGFNPQNNGEIIRIAIPPLTEERRKGLVKQAKQEAEDSKVAIRNIRRNSMEDTKQMKKDGTSEDEIKQLEDEIQKLTNNYVEKVDAVLAIKEKDIMTV